MRSRIVAMWLAIAACSGTNVTQCLEEKCKALVITCGLSSTCAKGLKCMQACPGGEAGMTCINNCVDATNKNVPMALLSLCGAPAGCFSTPEIEEVSPAACPGLPGAFMSCAGYPNRAWPEMCCDGRYSEALKSMCEVPLSAPVGVCRNTTALPAQA